MVIAMEQTILPAMNCYFYRIASPLLIAALTSCIGICSATAGTITVLDSRSCERWLLNQKDQERKSTGLSGIYNWVGARVDSAWLNGFLTAVNMYGPYEKDLLGAMNSETAAAWMSRYCLKSPQSSVDDGARQLVQELKAIVR